MADEERRGGGASWVHAMGVETPSVGVDSYENDDSDDESSEIRVRSGGFRRDRGRREAGKSGSDVEEERSESGEEEARGRGGGGGAKTSGGVEFITHEVGETDTLVGLCVKYGVPQQDILRANGMGAFAGGAALLLRREIQVPTAPLPKGWSPAPRRKSDAERGGHGGGRHDTFNGDLLAKFASDAQLERSVEEEGERELESIRNAAVAAGALPISTSGGAAADVLMKDKAVAGGGGGGAQELKRRNRLGGGSVDASLTALLPESTSAGSLPAATPVTPRERGQSASSAETSSDRSCFSLYPGHVVRVLAAKHQSFFGSLGGGGGFGNASSSSRTGARRTGGAGPISGVGNAAGGGGGDGKRFAYVNRRHGSNGNVEMERLNPDSRSNGGGGGVMRVPSVSKFVDKND